MIIHKTELLIIGELGIKIIDIHQTIFNFDSPVEECESILLHTKDLKDTEIINFIKTKNPTYNGMILLKR